MRKDSLEAKMLPRCIEDVEQYNVGAKFRQYAQVHTAELQEPRRRLLPRDEQDSYDPERSTRESHKRE